MYLYVIKLIVTWAINVGCSLNFILAVIWFLFLFSSSFCMFANLFIIIKWCHWQRFLLLFTLPPKHPYTWRIGGVSVCKQLSMLLSLLFDNILIRILIKFSGSFIISFSHFHSHNLWESTVISRWIIPFLRFLLLFLLFFLVY